MTENEAIEELHRIRPYGGIIPQRRAEALDVAIKALEEVQQYRTIGTPEECRAAVEKQTAKRPRIMGNAMICPSCPRCFKNASPTYCPSCGQRIDWGE